MSRTRFGDIEGAPIDEIRLRSDSGFEVSVIGFGATLRDVLVPVAGGGRRHVVLGYETLAGYAAERSYFGATCGRVANRIAGGRFTLDGKTHQLSLNENGLTHLHGGIRGFSYRAWEIADHGNDHVLLRRISPDGEEGYPGRVEAFCLYRLTAPGTLRIELSATTDAPTLINMANHAYFTLAENAEIWDHRMQLAADFYTPVDDALIPTGEIRAVAGTPYDFRGMRKIRSQTGGAPFDYDTNYVLNAPAATAEMTAGSAAELTVAARVISPNNDVRLEVATGEPGLQFYTGAGIGDGAPGIAGQKHFPHAGFCLEAQRFPDAVHHRHFPSIVLRPDDRYRQVTEYRFGIPSGLSD